MSLSAERNKTKQNKSKKERPLLLFFLPLPKASFINILQIDNAEMVFGSCQKKKKKKKERKKWCLVKWSALKRMIYRAPLLFPSSKNL